MKVGLGQAYEGKQLFGPDMREDPYPVYQQLRTNDPIHWDESLKAWVITRYDDVAWALQDPRLSSDRVSLARQRLPGKTLTPLFDLLAKLMVQLDEPDHTRIRTLVQKAFARTVVEQWTQEIQHRIQSLLVPALQRGKMDFIWDFAVPLPILVISEIVGIPEADRDRVKGWCDHFAMIAGNFYTNLSSAQLEQGFLRIQEFKAYLEQQVDQVRTNPRPDLLSSLVHVEEAGDRLTLDELLANLVLLLNAGNETTTNLLGNGLAALLQNPVQLQHLRNDPTLIPNAIEEFLRYDSPVQHLGRVALEDIERGNKHIHRGDLVLPVMGAANRDPIHFPNPDELEVTRQPIDHLTFGYGHHFCVGSQLARLEARLAFTTLLGDMTTLELAATELQHNENFNFRGYRSLPILLKAS